MNETVFAHQFFKTLRFFEDRERSFKIVTMEPIPFLEWHMNLPTEIAGQLLRDAIVMLRHEDDPLSESCSLARPLPLRRSRLIGPRTILKDQMYASVLYLVLFTGDPQNSTLLLTKQMGRVPANNRRNRKRTYTCAWQGCANTTNSTSASCDCDHSSNRA